MHRQEPLFVQIIDYYSTREGRDKVLKFFQYLINLLRVSSSTRYTFSLLAVAKIILNTRKVFRLGLTMNELYNIYPILVRQDYDLV